MATVVVHNCLGNKVELRLHEMSDGEHASFSQNVSGVATARRKGAGVVMLPGRNEVDVDFWREWVDQNRGSDLLNVLVEETPEKKE